MATFTSCLANCWLKVTCHCKFTYSFDRDNAGAAQDVIKQLMLQYISYNVCCELWAEVKKATHNHFREL